MLSDEFEREVMRETDDCIVWAHGKSHNGYGLVKINGLSQMVHVLAASRRIGPRPEGMDVAHGECHNKACFNYRHLSYKTRAGNVADMRRDGTDPSGEKNGQARLTWEDVALIRQSQEPSGVEAQRYGVSARHIRAIRSGRFWKVAA